ncbi:hypothetical protein B0J14DRAFT_170436 [Halenospora varia]|nr:hypothetical protein B0J14DRAFT_170436 [Halenospora varia]
MLIASLIFSSLPPTLPSKTASTTGQMFLLLGNTNGILTRMALQKHCCKSCPFALISFHACFSLAVEDTSLSIHFDNPETNLLDEFRVADIMRCFIPITWRCGAHIPPSS